MLAQSLGDFLLSQSSQFPGTLEAPAKELVSRRVDRLEHSDGLPLVAAMPANADFGLCKK